MLQYSAIPDNLLISEICSCCAGASQGTKDRYYLPPDGRIVRSRGEAMARIGELERFGLLVDAAAEAWEHETQVGYIQKLPGNIQLYNTVITQRKASQRT